MSKDTLPDWDEVLSAAARLQGLIPEAILVGGTAAALYAKHRQSRDADHVVNDLSQRFEEILQQLESAAGWKTARLKKPVLILGSLDGIETGVRQLIRKTPLETVEINSSGGKVRIPTAEEILRIKAALILQRNTTRDYVDFVALADYLGINQASKALASFDELYPLSSGESALQQLEIQLANPMPYDIDQQELSEYKNLAARWHSWGSICEVCKEVGVRLLRGEV